MKNKTSLLLIVAITTFCSPATFGAVANCSTSTELGKEKKIIDSFRMALSKSDGMVESYGENSAFGSRGETKISINLFPANKDNKMLFSISAQGAFFAGKMLIQDVMSNMTDNVICSDVARGAMLNCPGSFGHI